MLRFISSSAKLPWADLVARNDIQAVRQRQDLRVAADTAVHDETHIAVSEIL